MGRPPRVYGRSKTGDSMGARHSRKPVTPPSLQPLKDALSPYESPTELRVNKNDPFDLLLKSLKDDRPKAHIELTSTINKTSDSSIQSPTATPEVSLNGSSPVLFPKRTKSIKKVKSKKKSHLLLPNRNKDGSLKNHQLLIAPVESNVTHTSEIMDYLLNGSSIKLEKSTQSDKSSSIKSFNSTSSKHKNESSNDTFSELNNKHMSILPFSTPFKRMEIEKPFLKDLSPIGTIKNKYNNDVINDNSFTEEDILSKNKESSVSISVSNISNSNSESKLVGITSPDLFDSCEDMPVYEEVVDKNESYNENKGKEIDYKLQKQPVVLIEKLSPNLLNIFNKTDQSVNSSNNSLELSGATCITVDSTVKDDSKELSAESNHFVEFKRRVASQFTCENYFSPSIDISTEEGASDATSGSEFEILRNNSTLDSCKTTLESKLIDNHSIADEKLEGTLKCSPKYDELEEKQTDSNDEDHFDINLDVKSHIQKRQSARSKNDELEEKQTDSNDEDHFDINLDVKSHIQRRQSARLQKKKFNRFSNVDKRNTIAPVLNLIPESRPSIVLQPGKRFQRSLSIIRQMSVLEGSILNVSNYQNNTIAEKKNVGRKYQQNFEEILNMQPRVDITLLSTSYATGRRKSIVIVNEPLMEKTICPDRFEDVSERTEESDFTDTCDDTAIALSQLSISRFDASRSLIEREQVDKSNWRDLSARDIVLRKCNQTQYLPFDQCYPDRKLKNCCKIGEGVYGEVFLYKNELDPTKPIVMKIIPIEGNDIINYESQKKFDEIISEIVIAMELSELRNKAYNNTSVFNKVHQIKCVKGKYPERLLELWELYDEVKGSENDHPLLFGPDQLFVVLELENGGTDLEAYYFVNAEQSFALFYQVAYAFAVAEESFQFEHRDLHCGNVLVTPTDEDYIDFTLRGVTHSIRSSGICASIIDFTFSRITLPQVASTIYNDIGTDEDLFNASGDYQFDIYRLMRKKNGNEWQHFEPYTNVLWLHYLLTKMVEGFRYTKTKTKVHNLYMNKLKKLRDNILNYPSCVDFVLHE